VCGQRQPIGDAAGPGEVESGKPEILLLLSCTAVAGGRAGKVADFPTCISGGSHITYLAGQDVRRSWPGIRLKAVMKIIKFQKFKIIWAHSPNTRNESVRILRIRGMNLFLYWEYAERICTYSENTRNEVNIQTKFCCSYTENMRNESVHILRIREMNLFVH
jgi:hypothetical protein